MDQQKVHEFLYEVLQTEQGGIEVYEKAIQCAQNDELKEEWEEYLEQTRNHESQARAILEHFGLDPEEDTPGREVLRHLSKSLVQAMQLAQKSGDPDAAQIVAAECVEIAESKDHHNWEIVGLLLEKLKGEDRKVLKNAHDEIEDEEDEHYYHTRGWARELHLQSLGMRAVIPPPEEKKKVKTAIGAARAEKARSKMKESR